MYSGYSKILFIRRGGLIQTFTSAVYKTREMYAIDHPLANFDNYSICSNQGIQYRQGNTSANNDVKIVQIPNQLQIEVVGKVEYQNYSILNSLGQLVHQWQSNNKIQILELEHKLQTSGMYILHAQSANGNQSSKKFIYTK